MLHHRSTVFLYKLGFVTGAMVLEIETVKARMRGKFRKKKESEGKHLK
jgi:hypothetical protein